MRVSYKTFRKLLIDLNISKSDLRKATGLATETMTKLHRDEDISINAIKRICQICNRNIGDMMDFLPKEEK